jgi:hypothetical protein
MAAAVLVCPDILPATGNRGDQTWASPAANRGAGVGSGQDPGIRCPGVGELVGYLRRGKRRVRRRARGCAGQARRRRMSSTPRAVPNTSPSSRTLENSLAFLAFSAMTFPR